ncbi:MAG: hypothetical protein AB1540_02875 [Bdellovibrionota bacterium]
MSFSKLGFFAFLLICSAISAQAGRFDNLRPAPRVIPQYHRTNAIGYGNASVRAVTGPLFADRKLRVSIIPITGGTNVTKMAARVTLVQRGAANSNIPIRTLASKTVPLPIAGNIYRQGLPLRQKSDPALLDFSRYLAGAPANAQYDIWVDQVMTDYNCNTFCTQASMCTTSSDPYCIHNGGWYWTYDYHTQNYAVCCGTVLNQCQLQNCGVARAAPNSMWYFEVLIETEDTTRIAHP